MMDKPILFKAEMIKAILAGRKTQTRRLVKLPKWSTGWWDDFELDDFGTPLVICAKTGCWAEVKEPYEAYEAGDNLWVKETWQTLGEYDDLPPRKIFKDAEVVYLADSQQYVPVKVAHHDLFNPFGKVRPSIFMPRWFSRITLHVKKTSWVQRLQDISEQDAVAEGVYQFPNGLYQCYQTPEKGMRTSATASFMSLWDRINKKRGHGWDTNPFVWVTEFMVGG